MKYLSKIKETKKGMTIIELMVAMGIFTVVTTLAVGSFVAVSRMRMFALNLKESQQKIRIVTEMVSRYAKQADTVTLDPTGKSIDLYFKSDTVNPPSVNQAYASRFEIYNSGANGYQIRYYECRPTSLIPQCLDGMVPEEGVDLFSGNMRLDESSAFGLNNNNNDKLKEDENAVPPAFMPSLDILLISKLNEREGFPYYNSDYFEIKTKIILENLR